MRAVLKKWGMAFLEWLFTGVAFGARRAVRRGPVFWHLCDVRGRGTSRNRHYSPRGIPAPGHPDPGLPRRVGAGRAGVHLCGANPYRKLVEEQHGIERRGARLGAVHAVHGPLASRRGPGSGRAAPFNPGWALRACVTYDKYLWDRLAAKGTQKKALTPCNRMAFTLSGYNGGMGWTNRDRNLATRRGLDPDRYFGSVETVNAGRRASAKRENQRYVSFIFERQAAYVKAGWGPGVRCE